MGQVKSPVCRLFCFHDAGGGPEMFGAFPAELSAAGVEVHAVSLSRLQSPSQETVNRYLDEVLAYVRSRRDLPYAFFGHSLGGRLAWWVTQELVVGGGEGPRTAFVSASSLHLPRNARGEVDPERVLQLAFGELLPFVENLPALSMRVQQDCRFLDLMPSSPSALPGVPIVFCRGTVDPLVSDQDVAAWKARTRGAFCTIPFSGDHLYVYRPGSRRLLLGELARRLAECAAASVRVF